ncbi:MAG: hypothetical protein ACRDWA_02355 [Acidimicrobiia bacterium]
MPTESFSHRGLARASAEHIWVELQKPDTWRRIGGVSRISGERFDDRGDLLGYEFAIETAGQEYHGSARRLAGERLRRMVIRIDSSLLEGQIAVDLKPQEKDTWVELTMSMASKGFVSSMLFPVISKAVTGGFDKAVKAFFDSLAAQHRPPTADIPIQDEHRGGQSTGV